MEIIISGYGQHGEMSIGKFEVNENIDEPKLIWSDCKTSPSFVCTSGNMLFTGLEHTNGGEILFYMASNTAYKLVDKISINGGELCHLMYSKKYNLLYGSCYQNGNVAVVKVKDDKLVLLAEICEQGECESRSHCCVESPNSKYIYIVNIAQDRIYCYHQKENGIEKNKAFPYFQLEKGKGPRHLCFCEKTNQLYLVTEYTSELFVFDYNCQNGELSFVQCVKAVPETFSGNAFGSSIAISKNNKKIYSATRGPNTISVLDIANGVTTAKPHIYSCGGNYPRHIALSKDGKFLLSANQRSNNVTIINVEENGELGEIFMTIPFETPSYVEDIT